MTNTLVRPAQLKEVDQLQGKATFIVSVFGNEDYGGDIVEPGAFAAVIGGQKRMPKFAPNHDLSVEKRLGKVLGWRETPEGLQIDAQFNLEKQIAKEILSDFIFDPSGQEFSFSYDVAPGGQKVIDGVRHLTKISEVMDVGPVGLGMNPMTHLVGVKEHKGGSGPATDTSAWDGNRAMGECKTAQDYESITAGHHGAGEPGQRQHYAFPHHYLGKAANQAGVATARGRFGQAQDLTDREAARRHLFETHSLPSDAGKSWDVLMAEAILAGHEEKAGRVISSKNESKIRAAISSLEEVLSSLEDQAPSDTAKAEGKAEEPEGAKAEDHPLLDEARKEWAALVAEKGEQG